MSGTDATQMVVVRHGETVWNLSGRQQGQQDSELSELGVRQAQATADALAGEQVEAVYSSDLGRAMQTARMIGQRLRMEVVSDIRLRERHLGIMQGKTFEQIEQTLPEVSARSRVGDPDPDYEIPQGESIRQRFERGVAGAEDLARRHAGGRILLVTHGGILDSFFRKALGLALTAPRRFSIFNASINVFTIADGQWRLDSWGDIGHLQGMGTMDDW